MKLLLIDPNKSSLKVYRDIFEIWGFTVHSCYMKRELDQILDEKDSFQIIVTEIELPGIKCGPLVPILKQTFPETPIIVLTDHHSVSAAVQSIKNGASEFILKPFEPERIKQIIFRLLVQKQTTNKDFYMLDSEPDMFSLRQSLNRTIDRFLRFNQNLQLCDRFHRKSCEYISDAILMLDKNQNVILINQKMLKLLGIHKNNLIGCSIFNEFSELKNTPFYSIYQGASEYGDITEYKSIEYLRSEDQHLFKFDLKVIIMKSDKSKNPFKGIIFIGSKIEENPKKVLHA